MFVQALYSLQAYIITVLVNLIVRYLWCSSFGRTYFWCPQYMKIEKNILEFSNFKFQSAQKSNHAHRLNQILLYSNFDSNIERTKYNSATKNILSRRMSLCFTKNVLLLLYFRTTSYEDHCSWLLSTKVPAQTLTHVN